MTVPVTHTLVAPKIAPIVDIASLVAAAVNDVVLSNSSGASADELREVLSQAMTGAQSACQEILADAEHMGMESADPKARRKAAESPTAVLRDVAGMLVKIKADNKVTRLGVDPNNFLNFEASTFEMFLASTRIMGCVLGVVAVFTLASYCVVKSVAYVIAGVEDQFSMDHNYNETDFEDELAEEENQCGGAGGVDLGGRCGGLFGVTPFSVPRCEWGPSSCALVVQIGNDAGRRARVCRCWRGQHQQYQTRSLGHCGLLDNPYYFRARVHQRPGIGNWFVPRAPRRQAGRSIPR